MRAEQAERVGDLAKAAELRYGELATLQKKLEEANRRLQDQAAGRGRRCSRRRSTRREIAAIVSRWTGIPVSRMLEGEVQKLLKMEERLRDRVVGQDEAVAAVSQAVRRARAGLADPNRPLGSFTASWVRPGSARPSWRAPWRSSCSTSEKAMIRLDMSEYMEKHSVSRLIGAPPGYVGHEEGGQLTEAVRRRPYAVVLFDEIEKAHPDVFNTLLQILEDGRLTDGKGRVVDFKNTLRR